MNRTVFVLNGSNLNMLGKREPHLYGTTTLPEVKVRLDALTAELGLACDFRQTNHEGVLVDWIHEAYEADVPVVINPGGFSFASVSVMDALKLVRQPLVEVHITNIHQRGSRYAESAVSLVADGVICGLGVGGYPLALRAVADALTGRAQAAA